MSKYQGDGHMETIDPARLTLGCVVRMPYRNATGFEAVSAFGDAVVTGIWISFGATRQQHYGKPERGHYSTLANALKEAHDSLGDYVFVKLARPYCYCDNPFASMPHWLVGVESYEVMGNRILDTHKVVVNSTGAYALYIHGGRDLLQAVND